MDKKVKWIFFDVGTTLVDETEAYNHRIRDAIEGTDISFQQFNEKRIYFAKQNLKGDLEAIKYFGLLQTPWHKEDEVPYSSSEEILKYLYKKGYKIGIIANQSFGIAERLENWGILKYIDVVASSAELGAAKPDREIFNKALEMAECVAQEAVMIGDRLDNDISPAQKLGMQTIWVRQGFAIYQNLQLAECQPDYIVNNLSEIKEIFQIN